MPKTCPDGGLRMRSVPFQLNDSSPHFCKNLHNIRSAQRDVFMGNTRLEKKHEN